MTAAERLLFLSKATGAAGALLLAIGSGATAEAALLDYSALDSVTAAEHLLYEKVVGHGGGTDSNVNLVKLRESIKRAKDERDILEAEQIAESERIASEVLARISKAKEPEPSEPVVIPIPEAIEPEQVTQVEPLAPVNDLVSEVSNKLSTSDNKLLITNQISSNIPSRDDNETIALLLILAEID